MILLLLLFYLVLSVGSAHAVTYYVATNGSNSNNGTDISTPFLTIDKCARLLNAGDTCLVRGGTYTESGGVLIQRSGTAALPIRLANYPGEKPRIAFPAQVSSNRIVVLNLAGSNVAMGYITIEGFEVSGGWEGIKFYNMHNSTIRNMDLHDGHASGILGIGGHHNVFERNIIHHQGPFAGCAAGTNLCNQDHGMYMHGDSYIIRNNVIYDNIGIGVQHNGSPTSSYTTSRHPSPEFSGASNWVITDNTLAYQRNGPGVLIWGNNSNNIRIENNICYENQADKGSTSGQCVFFTSVTSAATRQIRNNHAYASGSGGQAFISGSGVEGTHYTQSGNVVNVSPPAFVNGGNNAVPASPDFRLTASAPVNIARVNEFPNNSTLVVGAYKTVANPACSITANLITCIYPASTAVPVQNLSTSGVSVTCTGSACPGSPSVSAVSREVGTDTHVQITVAGLTGNACEAANQAWAITHNSASSSWTMNDNVGPFPGSHQKLFSFTNLAVTNQCTGSGSTGYPAGHYIFYDFNETDGTTAFNAGSGGAALNGELMNGALRVAGKTGNGVSLTSQSTQHVQVPYGNALNPSTQSLTIAFGVNVTAASQSLSRSYFGSPLGTNQRLYIESGGGTWRLGAQASSASTNSELVVDAGWNHLCITVNATTDLITLHKNGVASTAAGGRKSITSYTLSGDFDLGRIADLTNGGGGTFDDFLVYQSVQDCTAIYQAFQGVTSTPGGTFAQPAYKFESPYLDEDGFVVQYGGISSAKDVVSPGAVAVRLQVHCQNVSNCDPTAFKFAYKKNGSSSVIQVPDVPTADGIYMWGASESGLNTGTTNASIDGSCTAITGTTQLTAAQVPNVDLAQNECVVLRYIVRISAAPGDYFDLRLLTESGAAFTGGYTDARLTVIEQQAHSGN